MFDKNKVENDLVLEENGSLSLGNGYFTSDFIEVSVGKTYSVSTSGSKRGKFFDKNKEPIQTESFSDFNPEFTTYFLVPDNVKYVRFSGLIVNLDNIMVNIGSDILPYEPYTGNQPSPSPEYPQDANNAGQYNSETQKYEVEVKLTGGNHFDISKVVPTVVGNSKIEIEENKIIITNGSGSSGVYPSGPNTLKDYCPDLQVGRKYILNFDTTGISKNIYLQKAGTGWSVGQSIEMTEDILQSRVVFYASGVNSYAEISNFIISDGTSVVPYEPYKEPQIVTITSDRPITKWDRLVEKKGVIGWEYGGKEIVFDGSDDEDWKKQGTDLEPQYYIKINDAENPYTSPFISNFYCDKFTTDNAYGSLIGAWKVRRGIVGGVFTPVFETDSSIDSIESWLDFLKENNIICFYKLSTPEFVPLSSEEQEALRELKTYFPISVISNDQNCQMDVTYAMDTKTYIDKKFEELQSALVTTNSILLGGE